MKKINLLNTFLIIISFLLAFLLPFKLFLISYAVLGPLHYLTEINWIKNKDFFVKNHKSWVIFCAISAVVIATPFLLKFFQQNIQSNLLKELVNKLPTYTNILIFLIFLTAIFLSFKLQNIKLSMLTIGSFLLGILLINFDFFNVWIGVFLPTIIHVYLFTLLFMFYGSLKSTSTVGYTNVFLLVLIPMVIIFLEVKPFGFSKYIFNTYVENNFYILNLKIAEFLQLSDGKNFDFSNQIILKVQMFISFVYTYHYLNWFSKTTVIGWYKKTTKTQLLMLALVWIVTLVIYYNNYKAGLIFMLFLSYMHVFLEFPLNIISIKGIIKHFSSK